MLVVVVEGVKVVVVLVVVVVPVKTGILWITAGTISLGKGNNKGDFRYFKSVPLSVTIS